MSAVSSLLPQALGDLSDAEAPANAFVICQDPQRTGQLCAEVLVDPERQRIVSHPIEVVPGAGLRLQGRTFIAGNMSELVQYYGAYNGEPDSNWLLHTEANEDELERMPWYWSELPTVRQGRRKERRGGGCWQCFCVSKG